MKLTAEQTVTNILSTQEILNPMLDYSFVNNDICDLSEYLMNINSYSPKNDSNILDSKREESKYYFIKI